MIPAAHPWATVQERTHLGRGPALKKQPTRWMTIAIVPESQRDQTELTRGKRDWMLSLRWTISDSGTAFPIDPCAYKASERVVDRAYGLQDEHTASA